jgi:hypothetical protein
MLNVKSTITLATLALLLPLTGAADDNSVAYPDGYRDWRHIKTMIINPGHPLFNTFGGLHQLYANAPAVQGYRDGKFPDGAVIVFDLSEAVDRDNTITAGAPKVVGVMTKDSRRHAETGGWGFEGFAAGDRLRPTVGANAATACFECHRSEKAHDYVFSRLE